jgi:hypothetical protein
VRSPWVERRKAQIKIAALSFRPTGIGLPAATEGNRLAACPMPETLTSHGMSQINLPRIAEPEVAALPTDSSGVFPSYAHPSGKASAPWHRPGFRQSPMGLKKTRHLPFSVGPSPLGEGCDFDFYPSPLGRGCPATSGRVRGFFVGDTYMALEVRDTRDFDGALQNRVQCLHPEFPISTPSLRKTIRPLPSGVKLLRPT